MSNSVIRLNITYSYRNVFGGEIYNAFIGYVLFPKVTY